MPSAKKPSKAEIQRLIEAWARKRASQRASLQDEVHRAWERAIDRFGAKWGSTYDLWSPAFYDDLTVRADAWWNSRSFKGAGVDW